MLGHMAGGVHDIKATPSPCQDLAIGNALIGGESVVNPFAPSGQPGQGKLLHRGQAGAACRTKAKHRGAERGAKLRGGGGMVKMRMGDDDGGNTLAGHQGGADRCQVAGIGWAGVNQHQIAALADQIAVGSGAGHGRRVRGQNASYPVADLFNLTCSHQRLSFFFRRR